MRHLILLVLLGGLNAQEPPDFKTKIEPVLAEYCHACHGGKKAEGDVRLGGVRTGAEIAGNPELWREVVDQVRGGFMPPRKAKPKPTKARREELADAIEAWLEHGREAPTVTVRRLNATEYANTVRDLLAGVRVDPKTLPADPTAYGFDNIGDALFTSPLLVERYYDITKQIVRDVLGDADRRARLVPHAPNDAVPAAEAARRNLAPLVERAFRRPATDAEIEGRVAVVAKALESAMTWDDAMAAGLEAVLLSPHFLFRVEGAGKAGRQALSSHELAVRLSYLVWSTMPDDELRRVAKDGSLAKPEVLRRQAMRLLDDARSRALADNFAAQWLGYRDIEDHTVDYRRFLWLDDELRRAMYEESAATFDALVREGRPILELLDADTIFVNQRLAKHYGIPGVSGAAMRRVPVGEARFRGGVLGMASILTVTSFPLRTSPVVRGKWILERILGTPPPPPPADAGVLPADDKQKDGLTLRQRLERHRADAKCASCHATMDPYGLALENLDGVGRWRDSVHKLPIDAKTELPDGTVVDGPAALKAALMKRKDDFARTMAEALFVYAIGRPVEATDRKLIRALASRTLDEGGSFRTLLAGLVASDAFRFRTAR